MWDVGGWGDWNPPSKVLGCLKIPQGTYSFLLEIDIP